jgi:hypothetical protein
MYTWILEQKCTCFHNNGHSWKSDPNRSEQQNTNIPTYVQAISFNFE